MKVILKETISSLGIIGSEVNVADGYARNYLLPQRKAVPATPQQRKILEQEKAKFELQIAKEKEQTVVFELQRVSRYPSSSEVGGRSYRQFV
mgnify:CR=1 FL=1